MEEHIGGMQLIENSPRIGRKNDYQESFWDYLGHPPASQN
jgi:hypothetical protein